MDSTSASGTYPHNPFFVLPRSSTPTAGGAAQSSASPQSNSPTFSVTFAKKYVKLPGDLESKRINLTPNPEVERLLSEIRAKPIPSKERKSAPKQLTRKHRQSLDELSRSQENIDHQIAVYGCIQLVKLAQKRLSGRFSEDPALKEDWKYFKNPIKPFFKLKRRLKRCLTDPQTPESKVENIRARLQKITNFFANPETRDTLSALHIWSPNTTLNPLMHKATVGRADLIRFFLNYYRCPFYSDLSPGEQQDLDERVEAISLDNRNSTSKTLDEIDDFPGLGNGNDNPTPPLGTDTEDLIFHSPANSSGLNLGTENDGSNRSLERSTILLNLRALVEDDL